MQSILSAGISLHVRDDGPKDAPTLMFGNSLGTDLRVWDLVFEQLAGNYRVIRYDKRGHGLSDCPDAPYAMEQLVDDAEAIVDALGLKEIHFIGLSIGGLIGQGLAARRPDLVCSLVLMDTAAKIGTPAMWNERITALRNDGLAAMTDAILERWFTKASRDNPNNLVLWRNMLSRTPLEGYVGCCHAIATADFRESTAALRMPVLGIAGDKDLATPANVVQDTVNLCGGQFHLVQGAGHLPCVEQPAVTASLIDQFIADVAEA